MTQCAADFSEYIVFADESGDHSLSSVNPDNPTFVLAFCIFKKADYISYVKSAVAKFKIDCWGHDLTVLHNYDIRHAKGEFSFLLPKEKRSLFMGLVSALIKDIPVSIVATAVDKRYLSNNLDNNPYSLALESCLEQTVSFLEKREQLQHLTHLIVESRGRPEDKDLKLAFENISDRTPFKRYPLDIKFANKQTNSSGLQIADLVAHPIGKHVMKREQPNQAFDIVKEKLIGYPEYEGIGLKCHPLESERPRQTPRPDADQELSIHL